MDATDSPLDGAAVTDSTPPSLSETRRQIDEADRALVAALRARLDAVRRIGAAKEASGTALVDRSREAEVAGRWTALAEEAGLNPHAAGRVLREVLHWSKREQELEWQVNAPTRVRVAYQGARAANGDLAARQLMGLRRTPVDTVGLSTFDAVIAALQAGDVDYAFVPVENSIVGSIEAVNSLLLQSQLHVVDEEKWDVEHVLAAREGATLAGLRRALSHPVALRQCRGTLVDSLALESVEVWDTAGAAEIVAASDDLTQAAVCPRGAAEANGLVVLRDDVSDHPGNWTRFLLLGTRPEKNAAGVPSRTTLSFVADHGVGSLARCLAAFESEGINLTRLSSHVLAGRPGQYGFLVDLEGHVEDEPVGRALVAMRAASRQLTILGSYPDRSRGREMPIMKVRQKNAEPPVRHAHALPTAIFSGRRQLAGVHLDATRFVLIAGPSAVESAAQVEAAATMVREVGGSLLRGGAFQPRTSTDSFQGLGMEGVNLLASAGRRHGLPVVTEVLHANVLDAIAARADVLQIGAHNMQNFELLRALGRIDRPVLLKRGMSATIDEWLHAAETILAAGNHQVVLCEHGIRTFETSTRATLDLAAIAIVKERTNLPVIVDPSHAAGRRELVVPLALAAAAAGADGLIVECHPDPENALCDREQALTRDDMLRLVDGLGPILAGQGRTLA
ncbi:Phospho-2-dehydro-3-deoxyheptonate aldolase [Planctomycetes bacterium Poly30]|uniref:chorismate mutase n=1 Tax=Saltatorellus ferox TaxID=2528018 RepID=A0A518EPF4_9BACT|nr:Phospho-2-dehydro-3-deoxyheptonate aldolase [Planctomycetes bacterium Poly30]